MAHVDTPVSLLDFLTTGHLGPLSPCMTQEDVRNLLGPPDSWDDRAGGQTTSGESAYWIYGDTLEVSFGHTSPYQMNFFQLEHPLLEHHRRDDFGGRLLLDTNGLTRTSPPSRFLRMLGSIESEVQVESSAGNLSLRLWIRDGVEIFFTLADGSSAHELPDDAGQSLARMLREVEDRFRIECIYSFPRHRGQAERQHMRTASGSSTTTMSGNAYLALMSDREHPP